MKLTLTEGWLKYRRDEIGVVQDGVPIPYEWTGPLEITVDDIFERAATPSEDSIQSDTERSALSERSTVQFGVQMDAYPGLHLVTGTIGLSDTIIFKAGDTWALKITPNGVVSNPDVPTDAGAKAIFEAVEPYLKRLHPSPQFGVWQPIESAPRDGTKVDLWVVTRDARSFTERDGRRITDASWNAIKSDDDACWRHYRYGWGFEEIEDDGAGSANVATHWMFPPSPPSNDDRDVDTERTGISVNQTTEETE